MASVKFHVVDSRGKLLSSWTKLSTAFEEHDVLATERGYYNDGSDTELHIEDNCGNPVEE